MNLILDILLIFEKTEFNQDISTNPWTNLIIDNQTYENTAYHVQLLEDYGYIRNEALILCAQQENGCPIVKFRPDVLTMQGHDFAIVLTKPDKFKKIKSELKDAPFETVKKVVNSIASKLAEDYLLDEE